MDTNNGSKVVGRRITLQLLGAGIAAGGLLVLDACSKDNAAPAGGSSGGGMAGSGGAAACTALIDEPAKNLRRTLQYNDKAAVPEKHCSACAQYDETKYASQNCGGGCKLFAGPVNPNGGCLSFAPKGAPGAPSASGAKPT